MMKVKIAVSMKQRNEVDGAFIDATIEFADGGSSTKTFGPYSRETAECDALQEVREDLERAGVRNIEITKSTVH